VDAADPAQAARFLSQLLFGEVREEAIRQATTAETSQSTLAAVLRELLNSPQAHLH
jgi:hypothetical protein